MDSKIKIQNDTERLRKIGNDKERIESLEKDLIPIME